MVHHILTFIVVVWFFSLSKKVSFIEGAFLICRFHPLIGHEGP
jgi:hypothetical protein